MGRCIRIHSQNMDLRALPSSPDHHLALPPRPSPLTTVLLLCGPLGQCLLAFDRSQLHCYFLSRVTVLTEGDKTPSRTAKLSTPDNPLLPRVDAVHALSASTVLLKWEMTLCPCALPQDPSLSPEKVNSSLRVFDNVFLFLIHLVAHCAVSVTQWSHDYENFDFGVIKALSARSCVITVLHMLAFQYIPCSIQNTFHNLTISPQPLVSMCPPLSPPREHITASLSSNCCSCELPEAVLSVLAEQGEPAQSRVAARYILEPSFRSPICSPMSSLTCDSNDFF